MKNWILNFGLFVVLFVVSSCGSRKVTRINADTQTDISGRWNDTDASSVAKKLSKEALSANWLNDFTIEKGRKPVVIIGMVRNKSHEHIDVEMITKAMEKAFVNLQSVRVVQGGKFREALRKERAEQQQNASVSTMKKFGLETGADYMLQGTINSSVDALGSKKTVYYQVDFELVSIQTNEKVWIGDTKIKKFIED